MVALQTLPVLLLGPYGGVIADRVDKRRLMVVLQSAMGVQALILGLLTVHRRGTLGDRRARGAARASTTRSRTRRGSRSCWRWSGRENLRNAVSLNSVLVNVARAVGPAVAGILIATVGEGVCFLVNAASFAAVVASLVDAGPLRAAPSPPSAARAGAAARGPALRRRHSASWRCRC